MAPEAASVSAVKSWLAANGIEATVLPGYGDWLGFSTTVAKAGALFDAEFSTFRHLDTGKEQVRTLAYSVPAALAPHIATAHPTLTFTNPYAGGPPLVAPIVNSVGKGASPEIAASCATTVTPACVQALYGLPTGKANATGNALTVTGYIDQYAQNADLKVCVAGARRIAPR
jgi:tripeptidyl-peptidase-1